MRHLLEATILAALHKATRLAARGKRDRPEVARFLMDAEIECVRLQHALRLPLFHPDSFVPGPSRGFRIRDPKPRNITVVPFADRVVHHALCAAILPNLERHAIADSYACRPGKGQHAALRRARHFAAAAPWVWKGDISAYFASIPQHRLLALLRRLVPDGDLCNLLERIIHAVPHGLPIGALTSQHLANLYLGQLDHFVKDQLGVRCYLRYMDDFVLFGDRRALLDRLPAIEAFVVERLGLALNPRSCRLCPVSDGVPFLGFRVYPRLIRVRPQRWRRFRRRHLALELALQEGRLDEQAVAASVQSQFSHLRNFDTYRFRQRHLARVAGGQGAGRNGLRAGAAGRLMEQPSRQLACLEPQQERAREPQQRHRFSSFERSAFWPEGRGPRISALCPGADQTRVQRPPGLHRGTELGLPGGDPQLRSGVVAGLFLDEGGRR